MFQRMTRRAIGGIWWLIILVHIEYSLNAPVCIQCPPGEGALSCTQCVTCSEGYYSSHQTDTPCIPCSNCQRNMFTLSPCTITADVTCAPCDLVLFIGIHDHMEQCNTETEDASKNEKSSQASARSDVSRDNYSAKRQKRNILEKKTTSLKTKSSFRHVRDVDGSHTDEDPQFSSVETSMEEILKEEDLIPDPARGTRIKLYSTARPRDHDLHVDDPDIGSGEEFHMGVVITDLYDQSSVVFEQNSSPSTNMYDANVFHTDRKDQSDEYMYDTNEMSGDTTSSIDLDMITHRYDTTYIDNSDVTTDIIQTDVATDIIQTAHVDDVSTEELLYMYDTDKLFGVNQVHASDKAPLLERDIGDIEATSAIKSTPNTLPVTTTHPTSYAVSQSVPTQHLIKDETINQLENVAAQHQNMTPFTPPITTPSEQTIGYPQSQTPSPVDDVTHIVKVQSSSLRSSTNIAVPVTVSVVLGVIGIIVGVVIVYKCKQKRRDKWKPGHEAAVTEPLQKDTEMTEISPDVKTSTDGATETTPLNTKSDANIEDGDTSNDIRTSNEDTT